MKLSDKKLRKLIRSELLREYGLNERGESWNPFKFKVGGQEFEALSREEEKELVSGYKTEKKARMADLKAKLKDKKIDKEKFKELLRLANEESAANVRNLAASQSKQNLDAKAVAMAIIEDDNAELRDKLKKDAEKIGLDVDEELVGSAAKAIAINQIETGEMDSIKSQDASTKGLSKVHKKGSKGDEVRKIQEKLKSIGDKDGIKQLQITVDGDFGSATRSAVIEFQRKYNEISDDEIDVDGAVGPQTWEAMSTYEGIQKADKAPAVNESRRKYRLGRSGFRKLIYSELNKI